MIHAKGRQAGSRASVRKGIKRSGAAQAALISGAKTVAPFLIGIIPFGTITGVTLVGNGFAPLPAAAFSFLTLAGSAQLAAAGLISQNAPVMVVVATALAVNLRFMMYSASIAPHMSHMPQLWRTLLSFLLGDQAYAVCILKFQDGQAAAARSKRWFFLGCALPVWLIWQASTLAGVVLGMQMPQSWSLDFVIPLMFLSLLLPTLKDAACIVAGVVSGAVSVIGFDLPMKTGVVVAMVCGILAGFITETFTEQDEAPAK